jgi:D-alanyl-lipoteichoic acid acyltransferase DltB (MBOAT superfamily)
MLFNSYEFLFLFLPLALLGYHLLGKLRLTRAATAFLVVASLFFYSRWNIAYLPLLAGSILLNYFIASRMLRAVDAARRRWLLAALVFNIGLLGYFKYADFLIGNLNAVSGADFNLMHIVLPLGISFFTLQQIAYQIDAFEGLVEGQSIIDYALFVSFFPQLIAGPIVHHKEMMPQFNRLRNHVFNSRNAARGLMIFAIGLFKKVVIADTFAVWASAGFDDAATLPFFAAWSTSLCYTLQLYFDFSGYTDMALGIGRMFNIRLPNNFNSPYKATNIVDYWNRWHLTLTRFITAYIYTPIVRAFRRVSFRKAMVATIVTMFISGLWHGAAWTFVVWGLMHGVAIVIAHNWRKRKLKMPRVLAWLITFNFVNVALVVFRARDFGDAVKVLQGMAGLSGWVPQGFAGWGAGTQAAIAAALAPIAGGWTTLAMIALFLVVALRLKNSIELGESFRLNLVTLAAVVFLLGAGIYRLGLRSEFLYFQF